MVIILLFVDVVCVLMYALINRRVSGGTMPRTKYDDRVPFWPLFVYPYALGYYLWMAILYSSMLIMPPMWGLQLTAATLVACMVGYGSFVYYPTYVQCIYPQGRGVKYRLLQRIHRADRPNNACPSMHVYMTTIFMWFSLTDNPMLNALVALLGAAIIVSTILIKRHYVLDVACGLMVGGLSIAASYALVI